MTGILLECRGLTMRFGGVLALDGLDFTVNAGEVLGLIGPNGSGKTTFFNVVSGIYRLNAGTIHLEDSGHHAFKSRLDFGAGIGANLPALPA